jgi:hypothetical protein
MVTTNGIQWSMQRGLTDEEQALAYRFAHVPLPMDAICCDPWTWHGPHDWRRFFLTREWEVNGIWVSVAGEQNHRGGITRWMHVGGDDQCSTSDRTDLIVALVEAGRLFDDLTADG